MDPEPVAALVEASRQGDEEAWSRLVARFAPLVYGIAKAYRLRPADRDEVAGTVWLRLVQHLDGLREPEALPGWLSRTARNEALRVLKLGRRTVTVADLSQGALSVDEAPEVDEGVLMAELHHALLEAMSHLSEREQELMQLLMKDPPLGYAEIGSKLDIPVGSIGPTRQRCLDKLRRSESLRAFETSGGGAGRSQSQ